VAINIHRLVVNLCGWEIQCLVGQWFGVVVTAFVTSTKLRYFEPV